MSSLLFFLFSLSSLASFDFAEDRLCFNNSDPQMAEAPFPWGAYAVKTGACQGIAGVAAAFSENARFDFQETLNLEEKEVRKLIKKIVDTHKKGKSLNPPLTIPGFKHLYDFCLAYKSEFLSEAVLYNRDLALREIAKYYPKLMLSKGKIKTTKDLERVKKTLEGFELTLARGKLPLMLYYQHVVLVYHLHRDANKVILTVYDSNKELPREMIFMLDKTDKLIWDITPRN